LTDKNVLLLVFENIAAQPKKESELSEAWLCRKVAQAPSIPTGN
jgi:hypothetical protein